jgi:hypothetical protein
MKLVIRWFGVTVRVASIGAMAAVLAACPFDKPFESKPSCNGTTDNGKQCMRVRGTISLWDGTITVDTVEVAYQPPQNAKACVTGYFDVNVDQSPAGWSNKQQDKPDTCFPPPNWTVQTIPINTTLNKGELLCSQFNEDLGHGESQKLSVFNGACIMVPGDDE